MKKSYKSMKLLACALLASGAMVAQLSGVKTINSGVATSGNNYQSFTDFANDINNVGVSGGVTVNVAPGSGPYNEQVTFNVVSGVSSTKRVIINGNGNTLTWAANSSQPWTLGLNGTDWFTVNDLNIFGTDATYALVGKLSGGADNNTFYNCRFVCNQNGTSSMHCPFSISSSMNSPTSSGAVAGNYNVVNTCTLSNGYYGYTSWGPTSGAYNAYNEVVNSRITDWYSFSTYVYYNTNFTLRNNVIDRVTRTSSSTTYAAYIYYCQFSTVDQNIWHKLYDAQPGAAGTLYWYLPYNMAQNQDSRQSFKNNIITDIKHNGSIYMYMYYGAWDIHHNTFDWDYTGGNHTGVLYPYMYSNSSYGYNSIKNNIITMRKPGSGTRYGIYLSGVTGDVQIDYNNILPGTGSGGNYVGYGSSSAQTLAQWQSQGYDQNGMSMDPQYTSASDLHPTNTLLNNQGTPLGVPVDQWNMPRSGTTPDVGALEFLSVPCAGTPSPGVVNTPTYLLCPGDNASLILSNFSSDLGITYQWMASNTSSVGPFTAVPNATSVLYTTPPTYSNTWYQVVVTCTNTNQSASPVGLIQVAGTSFSTVPYYESFESIPKSNKLPNCSWAADNLGGSNTTYIGSNTQGRTPRTGTKFAAFNYQPATTSHYYTNAIWMEPGITYSASVWYQTEYYGYNNFTDLSLLVGPNQSTTGLQPIVSTGGPAVSNVYKSLSNTFTVPSPGYYYVAIRATSNGACCAYYLSWDDLLIEIPCSVNSPTMNVTANNTTICANQEVVLTASGADTYTWSTGDMSSVSSVTPAFPGVHTFYVTGSKTIAPNCPATGQQVIIVNPQPAINAFANPPISCPDKPVTLQAFGATNYMWSTSGIGPVITVTPATNSSYTVTGTNQYGCSADAVASVTLHPAANIFANYVTEACIGDLVLIEGQGGVEYEFISSSNYQTSNPANVIMTGPVMYTVVGTDANGCEGSTIVTINALECVGLSENTLGSRVFPNPTTGMFTIELNAAEADVQVIDVTGRVVHNAKTATGTFNVNIAELSNGVYTVKVQSNGAVETIRVIKD